MFKQLNNVLNRKNIPLAPCMWCDEEDTCADLACIWCDGREDDIIG